MEAAQRCASAPALTVALAEESEPSTADPGDEDPRLDTVEDVELGAEREEEVVQEAGSSIDHTAHMDFHMTHSWSKDLF